MSDNDFTAADLARLDEILGRAMMVSADQREAYVRQHCAGGERVVDEALAILDRVAETDGDLFGVMEIPTISKVPGNATVAARATGAPVEAPIQVPNHELKRLIGSGGFGQVWLAKHTLLGHYRAVKLIAVSMANELDGLRRLKQLVPEHPNLLPIEEVGIADDWIYCLMPLADNTVSGRPALDVDQYSAWTLDWEIRRRGRLSVNDTRQVAIDLVSALSHLHAHDVTHGDVKPANVVRVNGAWQLADYGLLRDLHQPSGQGHTPGYMPAEGPGTSRADGYALGVVLFQMLTGLAPARLPNLAEPEWEDMVVDGLEATALRSVILRATDRDESRRFASLREMHGALERSGDRSKTRQRRIRIGVLGAVILTAGLLTLAAVQSRRQTADSLSSDGARPQDSSHRAAIGTAGLIRSIRVVHYGLADPGDPKEAPTLRGYVGIDTSVIAEGDAFRLVVDLSQAGHVSVITADNVGGLEVHPLETTMTGSGPFTFEFPPDPDVWQVSTGQTYQLVAVVASIDGIVGLDEIVAERELLADPNLTFANAWTYDGRTFLAQGPTDRGARITRPGVPNSIKSFLERVHGAVESDSISAIAFGVVARDRNAEHSSESPE